MKQILLLGVGGQGIITSSIIIAEVEINLGREVVQLQSYTAAVRGGSCEAMVILSNDFIGSLKVKKSSIIIALSQESLDKYSDEIDENTLLIVDEDLINRVPRKCNLKKVPFRQLSIENFGTAMFANIIMLGYLVQFLENARLQIMKNIVAKRVPKTTVKENLMALEIGYNTIMHKDIISKPLEELHIDEQVSV